MPRADRRRARVAFPPALDDSASSVACAWVPRPPELASALGPATSVPARATALGEARTDMVAGNAWCWDVKEGRVGTRTMNGTRFTKWRRGPSGVCFGYETPKLYPQSHTTTLSHDQTMHHTVRQGDHKGEGFTHSHFTFFTFKRLEARQKARYRIQRV